MELQKIYDDTVRHLFKQGGAAKTILVSSSGHSMPACAYRGREGKKCAVGYWIPDELYIPEIEGEGMSSSSDSLRSPQRCLPDELRTQDAVDLLKALQIAHDNAFVTEETFMWVYPWDAGGIASRLRGVAESNLLNTDVLLECWPR